MELSDLRVFACAARANSLRSAAAELSLSPSAVSKALKRLEQSIGSQLFDRLGRGLALNERGRRLLPRARELLDLAAQTRSEFDLSVGQIRCRVAASSLLQWRYARSTSDAARSVSGHCELEFVTAFEEQAVKMLAETTVDFALVSGEVINGDRARTDPDLHALALGPIRMQLAAAVDHPLLRAAPSLQQEPLAIAGLAEHEFTGSRRSAFCGIERGESADGWPHPQSRRMRWRSDELRVQVEWVRQGLALAYLPDFIVQSEGLRALQFADHGGDCVEHAYLLWRPNSAHGWHRRMVDQFRSES